MQYVSTSCLKGENTLYTKDVFKVLEIYKKLGIKNIELGSAHKYFPDAKPLMKYKKENNANFILHVLFPPAKKQFIMNIASQNPTILKDSISAAKKAIETCGFLGSNLYSMHPGLLCDYTLDLKPISKKIKKEAALKMIVESMNKIISYAEKYDVKVAVENMPFNIEFFDNPDDMLYMTREIKSKHMGFLLDIGHMHCTYHDLKSRKDFVRKIRSKIFEIHVHENNNSNDDHFMLKNPDLLKPYDIDTKNIAVTMEPNGLTEKEIVESIKVLKKL